MSEIFFLRKSTARERSGSRWSALKTDIQVPLKKYIYIIKNICIYIHVLTINEKRGHEFERELGRIYGSVW